LERILFLFGSPRQQGALAEGRLRRGAASPRGGFAEGPAHFVRARGTRLANSLGMSKQAKCESLVAWQRADDLSCVCIGLRDNDFRLTSDTS
jgi:hypothetical protein